MEKNQISDEMILEKLSQKSTINQGFSWLLQKYKERLYWHIRRMVHQHEDANDVLQNTLVKIYRGINNFKGDAKLYTWLYRIATNESLTFLKKQQRQKSTSIDNEELNLNNKLKADTYFDGNDIQHQLQLALRTLPEKQHLVFNMRYFEEIPYKEMSKALNTSVGALKASYHHAVKKIEAFLKKEN